MITALIVILYTMVGGFLAVSLTDFVGIGLGSPGNPYILTRYMSIDDPKQLRISAVIATIWNVFMGWGAVMIGVTGRDYYPRVSMLPGGDTENPYPVLALGVLGIATFIISTLAVIIISLLTDAPAGIQAEMELMKPRYKRKREPKIPTLRNSR